MNYLILTLVVLLAALMTLRLRIRFRVGSHQRFLFVGIGRSGQEVDFVDRTSTTRLMGFRLKTMKLGKRSKEQPEPVSKDGKIKKPKKKWLRRQRSWRDFVRILPSTASPLWKYGTSMLASVIVEQMQGKIEAGFEQPDRTGLAYGYYQSALAAAPAVVGKIEYLPVWDRSAFKASLTGSVALPIYRLVYYSILLVFRLPLREILKLAIGKKKGDQDD